METINLLISIGFEVLKLLLIFAGILCILFICGAFIQTLFILNKRRRLIHGYRSKRPPSGKEKEPPKHFDSNKTQH